MLAATPHLPLTAAILFSAHLPRSAEALAADIVAIMALLVVQVAAELAQAAQEVQPPADRDLPEPQQTATFVVAVAVQEALALHQLVASE